MSGTARTHVRVLAPLVAGILVAAAAFAGPAAATPAQAEAERAGPSPTLLFVADGMRQDLIEQYAAPR